nr:nicotinate-nucleotide--dimethylbenzimidazole phosphoribosyltransferase [Streptomyces sp. DSM 41633]
VRRGSGNIAVEDALSAEETAAAVDAGRQIADDEVDAGADLLIAGDMGIGNTTAATTLVAALTGAEPVAVVGRGTGIDDLGWMRKAAAVRDALYRAREVTRDPLGLLRVCGGADLAAMAGFLAQAAVRRTPVLLDGLV